MSLKYLNVKDLTFVIQGKHGCDVIKLKYKNGTWVGDYNEEWDSPMSCAEFYHLKTKYGLSFKEDDIDDECPMYMEYNNFESMFLGDLKDYETIKRLEKLYSEFYV